MTSHVKSFTDNLWEHATTLYSRPAIESCCLQLQDSYGASVNVMLFASWLQHQNIALTSERLMIALNAIQNWNANYVQILRHLRRAMKTEFAQSNPLIEDVREHIKTAELLAEKHELICLEEVALQWGESSENEKKEWNNLVVYLQHLKIPDEEILTATRAFNQNSK